MGTFVLVHDAWAGGWIWITPLLRAVGHDVHATTTTGMGDRVHLAGPAVDLDTHISDVANMIGFEDLTDVTLVGWSYGGMIITGVAERLSERPAGLIYLDALVPTEGETATTPSAPPKRSAPVTVRRRPPLVSPASWSLTPTRTGSSR